jgi:hypothetical protein
MKQPIRNSSVYSIDPELEAIVSKLQKQTKSRKQVTDEIEWAKAGTRKAVAKMLKK